MYFPVLRGKQFELIAVRELVSHLSSNPQLVHPIIEPVRSSNLSPLVRFAEALQSQDIVWSLVTNPTVGDLSDGPNEELAFFLRERPYLDVVVRVTETTPNARPEWLPLLAGRTVNFLIEGRGELPPWLRDVFTEDSISFSRDLSLRFRRRISTLRAEPRLAILEDHFPHRPRNSDYLEVGPSLFTEDHLFFEDEGLVGFGDYATVGEEYAEGGWAPRAVAIHWTYYDYSTRAVFIRHFTSESNRDTVDVPGKFREASEKLNSFLSGLPYQTAASQEILSLIGAERFPGLGSLKKLSIKNHLELMDRVLRGTL